MPNISFVNGAELAGRAPGEAIAGFNSGIGAIDAINNARNKQILAPIEQDTARARLAQIQSANEFAQQVQPYELATQRYNAAKTQIPIKDPTGFTLVQVPQMNANGTPSVDEQGKPIYNVMKQATGNEINATTGATSPFQEITGVQTPADTLALHSAYAQKARDYAEVAAANTAIRQQLADTAAKNAETNAAYKGLQGTALNAKIDHWKALDATGKYDLQRGTDTKTGQLVIVAVNKRDPSDYKEISTGLNPVQTENLFTTLTKMGSGAPPPPVTTTPNSVGSMFSGLKNLFGGSSAPADQPATLPTITASPSGQASANPGPPDSQQVNPSEISTFVNSAFAPASAASPSPVQDRYVIRQKK
jgi:hypothetical protein